ncbi:MAG: hypothetical protein GXO29_05310, partial [Thermotogae bacterium]|nr:hypothetical protein [Thermotogota bacterium]
VWDSALIIRDFRQQHPSLGGDPPYPTEARFFYTDEALYVAFKCSGKRPVLQRGSRGSLSPDNVAFALDPYGGNGKRYYIFSADVFGNRADVEVNGGIFNSQWDTEWDAAGTLTEDGYIVEMKIPFKAFRYRRGTVWGVAFSRWTSDGYQLRSPLNRHGVYPDMHPVEIDAPLSWALSLIPYLTYRKDSLLNPWTGDYEEQSRIYGGGDLRFTLEDNFLHLTVKPDFADVESDPYYINVSRYRYFLQERRPFFTHDKELFQPNFNDFLPYTMLVYTRNIGSDMYGNDIPITYGIKGGISVLGTNLALMNVRTDSGQDWKLLRTNYKGKYLSVGAFWGRYSGYYPIPDLFNPGQFVQVPDTNILADMDVAFNYGYLLGGFALMHADYYDELSGWKSGWLRNFGFGYKSPEWETGILYSEIDSLFYAERITFMPYAASRDMLFKMRRTLYNTLSLNSLSFGFQAHMAKEAGEPYSKGVEGNFALSFGRGHSVFTALGVGDEYEYDPYRDTLIHFFGRNFALMSLFNFRSNYIVLTLNAGEMYNYATGELGTHSQVYMSLPWRFSQYLRVSNDISLWNYPGMAPTLRNILRLTLSVGNIATARLGWEKVLQREEAITGIYDRVWVFLSFERGLTGLYISLNTKLLPDDSLSVNPLSYHRADYIFGVKLKGYFRL